MAENQQEEAIREAVKAALAAQEEAQAQEPLTIAEALVVAGEPGFKFIGATHQGPVVILEYEKSLLTQVLTLTVTMVGDHYVDVSTSVCG